MVPEMDLTRRLPITPGSHRLQVTKNITPGPVFIKRNVRLTSRKTLRIKCNYNTAPSPRSTLSNGSTESPRLNQKYSSKSSPGLPRLLRGSTTGTRQLPRASLAEETSITPRHDSSAPSVPISVPGNSKRISFASVGKKVTSLVRTRMAFGVKKTIRIHEDSKDEEEIVELPKSPRFSSFLSLEAQFAMMKGYEDVIHEEIVTSLPQYRSHLQRYKTPIQNIGNKNSGDTEEVDADSFGPNVEELASDNYGTGSSGIIADNNRICVKNMSRRASMPVTSTFGFAKPKPRIKSSSSAIISRGQRLVLTYRLESAMDILDTLRGNTGRTSISPRVQTNQRQITPVKDFNSWRNVWHKEFDCRNDSKRRTVESKQYIRA